jgi:hypothetical protein
LADGASAVGVVDALSPPAALARSPIRHLARPHTKEVLREKHAQHFSQNYDVRAWLLTENALAPALGTPPPLAALVRENTVKFMQLLLFDGRFLASFLRAQDLRRLSETCKKWRGAIHQVAVLSPQSVHATPTDGEDIIVGIPTLQTLHGGRGRSLSMLALRAHAAQYDRQQKEWDDLVFALQEGKAPQVTRLDVGIRWWQKRWRPRMVCETVTRLASSFCPQPNINLANHAMGTKGALALADRLQHTPHFRHLDLQGNNIGDEGIRALAGILRKILQLEFLDVSSCGMGTPGALHLGQNFRHLHHLKYLSFSSWYAVIKTPIFYHLRDRRKLEALRALGPIIANGMIFGGEPWTYTSDTTSRTFVGKIEGKRLRNAGHESVLPERIRLIDRANILTSRKCNSSKSRLQSMDWKSVDHLPKTQSD